MGVFTILLEVLEKINNNPSRLFGEKMQSNQTQTTKKTNCYPRLLGN